MCNVGHSLKLNRFLAASLLVRGKMKVVTDGAEGAGGKQPKTKTRQIERDDVRKSIETLQKRKTLNFLPWQNANSWKLGISNAEPKQPKKLAESMAAAPMQSCLIGNTTAVRSLFLGQYRRFLKLFYNKAYVWHFLEANGELEEFYEAKDMKGPDAGPTIKESVRKLLDAYEELLSRSAVAEDPKGKGRLGEIQNADDSACPAGTLPVAFTDAAGQQHFLGADIDGCGLTDCDDRFAQETITQCRDACGAKNDCESFNWAGIDEDMNYWGKTVCTLYPTDTALKRHPGKDGEYLQHLCKKNPYGVTTEASKCEGCDTNNPYECWKTCGGPSGGDGWRGSCSACDSPSGTPGACCKQGLGDAPDEPAECKRALAFPATGYHVCVLLAATAETAIKRKFDIPNVSDSTCPAGSLPVAYTDGFGVKHWLGADIEGCGLTHCDDRHAYDTITQCRDACGARNDCESFNWAGKDEELLGKTVCTLYQTAPDTALKRHPGKDGEYLQHLCAMNPEYECWTPCGGAPGFCSNCDSPSGTKGACCMQGNAAGDPEECKRALAFPATDYHVCVLLDTNKCRYTFESNTDCGAGWLLDASKADTDCGDSTCTRDQCCEMNPYGMTTEVSKCEDCGSREYECWGACGGKGGFCSNCDSPSGTAGACCVQGNNDPDECKRALAFPATDYHVCVLLDTNKCLYKFETDADCGDGWFLDASKAATDCGDSSCAFHQCCIQGCQAPDSSEAYRGEDSASLRSATGSLPGGGWWSPEADLLSCASGYSGAAQGHAAGGWFLDASKADKDCGDSACAFHQCCIQECQAPDDSSEAYSGEDDAALRSHASSVPGEPWWDIWRGQVDSPLHLSCNENNGYAGSPQLRCSAPNEPLSLQGCNRIYCNTNGFGKTPFACASPTYVPVNNYDTKACATATCTQDECCFNPAAEQGKKVLKLAGFVADAVAYMADNAVGGFTKIADADHLEKAVANTTTAVIEAISANM
eukprot:g9629.t1